MTVHPDLIQILSAIFTAFYITGILWYSVGWWENGVGNRIDKVFFWWQIAWTGWISYRLFTYTQEGDRLSLAIYMLSAVIWLFVARWRMLIAELKKVRTLTPTPQFLVHINPDNTIEHYPYVPETFWSPEPITAYRVFAFDKTNLLSKVASKPFRHSRRGKPVPATCRYAQPHKVPDWVCSCGYYALKPNPNRTPAAHSLFLDLPSADRFDIAATVELFGNVIEHAHGYRAQYMRVIALHPRNAYELAVILPYASRHKIEIRPFEGLAITVYAVSAS